MNEQQRSDLLAAVVEAMQRLGIEPKSVVLFVPGGEGGGTLAIPGFFQGWAPLSDLLPPGAQTMLTMFGGGKR